MIPENVIEALASVRQSGATNMFDQHKVIQLVDVADEEAADWLRNHPLEYVNALNAMGQREFPKDGE